MELLTKPQITAKITSIKGRSATLRNDVHEILCHAAGHAYQHGDVTNFTRLFAATSGMARTQMVEWVREFGFATFKKDGSFKLNKEARADADFTDGAAVAEYLISERKWYENEPDAAKIVNALDVAKRLESLARAVEKASNDNKPMTLHGDALTLAMGKFKKAVIAAHEKRVRANQSAPEPQQEGEVVTYAIAAE